MIILILIIMKNYDNCHKNHHHPHHFVRRDGEVDIVDNREWVRAPVVGQLGQEVHLEEEEEEEGILLIRLLSAKVVLRHG